MLSSVLTVLQERGFCKTGFRNSQLATGQAASFDEAQS